MIKEQNTDQEQAHGQQLEARACLYSFLALALTDPLAPRWQKLLDKDFQKAVCDAAVVMREATQNHSGQPAPGELPLSFLDGAEMIKFLPGDKEDGLRQHQDVFGLVPGKHCPPYEIDYHPHGFSVSRSQHLADVAGFYKAFGLEPSATDRERHDHISLELEFMGWLIAKEAHARQSKDPELAEKQTFCRDMQRMFCQQHILWWLPAFATSLRLRADGLTKESDFESPADCFFGAVAKVLAALSFQERVLMDIQAVPGGGPPGNPQSQPEPYSEVEDEDMCAGCGQGSGESLSE